MYSTWNEFDGSQTRIYLKKFNGTAWVPVGSTDLNVDSTTSIDQQDIACVGKIPYVV